MRYHSEITQAVRAWLRTTQTTQYGLALGMGISTSNLSRRMTGEVTWSAKEIETLAALGVDIPAPNQTINSALTDDSKEVA